MTTTPRTTRTPYRVCFVCSGNICRSPMAESVFRARVREAGLDALFEVDSAGTGGWWEGSGADRRTVGVLTRNGYEENHVARQFRPEWFAGHDLVVALDSGHLRELRAMAPSPQDAAKVRLLLSSLPAAGASGLDVPDPYYGDLEDFEHCLTLIEPATEALLEELRARITGPLEDTGAR